MGRKTGQRLRRSSDIKTLGSQKATTSTANAQSAQFLQLYIAQTEMDRLQQEEARLQARLSQVRARLAELDGRIQNGVGQLAGGSERVAERRPRPVREASGRSADASDTPNVRRMALRY